MTVRTVNAGDAPKLVDLFAQLGYPTDAEAIGMRLRRNTRPEYEAWVFTTGAGEIIGFAGGHVLLPWEHGDPLAQLMILVVDERHRGTGAGSALVTVFEEWAARQGARQLVVGSGNRREDAHRFYAGRGFEATGVRFRKPAPHTQPHT